MQQIEHGVSQGTVLAPLLLYHIYERSLQLHATTQNIIFPDDTFSSRKNYKNIQQCALRKYWKEPPIEWFLTTSNLRITKGIIYHLMNFDGFKKKRGKTSES